MLENRTLVFYVVATGPIRQSTEREGQREVESLGARKQRNKAHVRSLSERILNVVTCSWKCLEADRWGLLYF